MVDMKPFLQVVWLIYVMMENDNRMEDRNSE